MRITALGLEIVFTVRRFRYYEIVSTYTGEVVGVCTTDGVQGVRARGCGYTLREMSKRRFQGWCGG